MKKTWSHFGAPGISLADILVAVAIFAVAFLALLGLYPLGMRSIRQAQEVTEASFLAEQVLESERALAFASIQSKGPFEVEADRVQSRKRHGNESATRYRYQVLVTPLSDEFTTPAKDLVVQVSWESGSGLKLVSLETEVMEP